MGRIKKRYLDLAYPNGLTASDIPVDSVTKVSDHLLKTDIKFSFLGTLYTTNSVLVYDAVSNINIKKVILRVTERGDDTVIVSLTDNGVSFTNLVMPLGQLVQSFDILYTVPQGHEISYNINVTPNTTSTLNLFITIVYTF
jgi:hypothetical protein